MIADFFADLPFASVIATGLGVFFAVFGVFRSVDGVVSKALKRDVAALMYRASDRVPFEVGPWIARMDGLIGDVFGRNPWSLRAFLTTALISCAMCVVITVVAMFMGLHVIDLDEAFLGFLLFLVFINLPVDYLSVVKSRWLIATLRPHRPWGLMRVLVLDAIVTVCLFVLAVTVALTLGDLAQGRAPQLSELFSPVMLRNVISLRADPDLAMGLFFYTTFFTTVWMTLFVVGGLVVHALATFRVSVTYILDVDGKPLQSLGVILGVVMCLLTWAGLGLGEALGADAGAEPSPFEDRLPGAGG